MDRKISPILNVQKLVNDHRVVRHWPKYQPDNSSWLSHLKFAFLLVSMLKPKLIVELGVFSGASFMAFNQGAKDCGLTDCRVIGIDTFEGDVNTGIYADGLFPLVEKEASIYPNSKLIKDLFDNCVDHFNDGEIDILHIDGCHTYEAVKHDFETWFPKMSDKGVILFHDTQEYGENFGVYELWEEIECKYPSMEIKFGSGLGILAVGKDVPQEFLNMIAKQNHKLLNGFLKNNINSPVANSHFLINWIPDKYRDKLNIIWSLDKRFKLETGKPNVWVEHGSRDSEIPKQLEGDHYYICNDKGTFDFLIENNKKAYWCGSYYNDKANPDDSSDPRLLVYIPDHLDRASVGEPDMVKQPLTLEEIKDFCKKYDCDDHITSLCDDTDHTKYSHLKTISSDRWTNDNWHIEKCKYLYNNAKVVIADNSGTFDEMAKNFGIPVVVRGEEKFTDTFTDGRCCERILMALDDILEEEGLSNELS